MTPKQAKSKVRGAAKPKPKRQRQSKIAARKAPSKTPRQAVEVSVEDTIIDVIEEPVPGVVVVTEYERFGRQLPFRLVLSLSPASVPRRKIANGWQT